MGMWFCKRCSWFEVGDALGIQAQKEGTNPIRLRSRTKVRQPRPWRSGLCALFVGLPVGSTPESVQYWRCLLLNGR